MARPPTNRKTSERDPAGREAASGRGDQVQHGQGAEHRPAAVALGRLSSGEGADDRPEERARDREAELGAVEPEAQPQGLGGAGDDGGVEAEQEAAQRGHGGAADELRDGAGSSRSPSGCGWDARIVRYDPATGACARRRPSRRSPRRPASSSPRRAPCQRRSSSVSVEGHVRAQARERGDRGSASARRSRRTWPTAARAAHADTPGAVFESRDLLQTVVAGQERGRRLRTPAGEGPDSRPSCRRRGRASPVWTPAARRTWP